MVKFSTEKLVKRIDDQFESHRDFAKAIGMPASTLCRTLQHGNWKIHNMKSAVEVLRIPARDIPQYFFTERVTETKQ